MYYAIEMNKFSDDGPAWCRNFYNYVIDNSPNCLEIYDSTFFFVLARNSAVINFAKICLHEFNGDLMFNDRPSTAVGEYITPRVIGAYWRIYFDTEEDAVAFILKWG